MIVKIIILALMAMFYICYFSKMISQKRQGIDTDQLGKDKEGFVKFIEISLKLTTNITPAIQLISICFCKKEQLSVPQIAGIIITTFGVAVFIASVIQMKDNWRAGVQKKDKIDLVTDGIYQFSRNPAFLGFDLMYIGILMAFFNWYLCIITAIALICF